MTKLSSLVFDSGKSNQPHTLEEEDDTCHFPKPDPFDSNVVQLSKLDRKTLQCNGPFQDFTYIEGNKLIVNQTKIKKMFSSFDVTCKYQDIKRKDRDLSAVYGEFTKPFKEFIQLPRETEFIFVVCQGTTAPDSVNPNKTEIPQNVATFILSKNYYALIPKHDQLCELENLRMRKRLTEIAPKETLNVIMIGFDSVPRNHFLRAMNRTYDLLINELHSYDMAMHSQVGKNSFPNFLSLLTGRSEQETNRWWDSRKYEDAFDILWKYFERAGYRTLFTEDWPHLGAFNFYLPGFFKVPTVHYSKPISVAIERDEQIWKAGRHCVGNQPEILFHLDYLKRFLDTFSAKPVFSFVYLTRIGHDDVTMIKAVDDHVYNFYNQLNQSGHLNNTMLITFSDHGLRFGPLRHTTLGDFENRSPFVFFTFPPWFREKYSDVAKNLKTNTGRLTTHYDTHATIRDLLYFRSSGDNPLPKPKHGISLFKEIPKNRTCTDANIPIEFCMCGYQNSLEFRANIEISTFLSEVFVSYLNSKIDQNLCQNLTLHKFLELIKINTNDKRNTNRTVYFRIKIETVPGNGIFEAGIQADDTSGGKPWEQLTTVQLLNVKVGDGLDRLNMYRGQSDCVKDSKMKLFCYCKNILKA